MKKGLLILGVSALMLTACNTAKKIRQPNCNNFKNNPPG